MLATTLTKLVTRFGDFANDPVKSNELKAEAMLIMISIIRIGKSEFPTSQIDEDSHDRVLTCLRVLSSYPEDEFMKEVFLVECRNAYSQLIQAEEVNV